MIIIAGSLINAESDRTNLPPDNLFSNSYDMGKSLNQIPPLLSVNKVKSQI